MESVMENGTCGASQKKTVTESVTENMAYEASWKSVTENMIYAASSKSVTESGTCGALRKWLPKQRHGNAS